VGAEDNIKTIQSVYEAFGRGDVEGILAVLTDDVDWASDPNPWIGVRPLLGRSGHVRFAGFAVRVGGEGQTDTPGCRVG